MIRGYKTVAICVAEMQNEDVQEMLFLLHRFLEQNDWKTLIFDTCTDLFQDTEFDHGEMCVFRLIPYDNIDAIVVFGRTIKQNNVIQEIVDRGVSHRKNVIVIDNDNDFDGAINLKYEEENAFRQLVEHLVTDHGLTRINCIAGIKGNIVSDKRLNIFRNVLASHNIPFDEEKQLGYGGFYDVPAKAVMEKFLADPQDIPQAICCLNDSMAIAACDVLTEKGYSVPQNVIVTGFDGIQRERFISPRLTTCRRNMQHMAEFIGKIVMDGYTEDEEMKNVYFPFKFEASESCGCSRTNGVRHNSTVNMLYDRTKDSVVHDRSMTNMLTRMNMAHTSEEMQGLFRHYIDYDSYICVNQEIDTDKISYHWYNTMPFSREMQVYRYFKNQEIITTRIPIGDLVPDWQTAWERSEPIAFIALHDQADCQGYFATFLDDSDYNSFLRCCQRVQRLVSNVDNIISLHVQQDIMARTNRKLKAMQEKIIAGFADLVESRDDSTGEHIKRTQEYISILVKHVARNAKYAWQLSPKTCELIVKAAPLHDIGKIKVSDTILNKPGRLTAEEFEIMKKHCVEGGRIIDSTLTGVEDDDYIEIAKNVALYHHEKWDGTGYPGGLAGENIPLCARLMAIVDVFDALSSKRVYKEAYSLDETFNIIAESRGSHFDPDLVDIFFEAKKDVVECYLENSGMGIIFQRR